MRFDQDSFKAHVRLAMARCRLVHSKLLAASRAARSSIADLLSADRLDSARIKTRLVIRDDYLAEAVEQLECYLDDLLHGSSMVAFGGSAAGMIDESMKPACAAVIYAHPRVDVPELTLVRDDLASRFGRDFCTQCINNADHVVDDKFCLKLAMRTPDEALVERYLETIADSFGIKLQSSKSPPPYTSNTVAHADFSVPAVGGFDEIAKRFEQLKRRP